jgi:N utilization substance protein B
MPNRHLSRICVMQTLYEYDLRPSAVVDEVIERNIAEKSKMINEKNPLDKEYVTKTVEKVIKKVKAIDKLIAESAPEWPIDQIAKVDKNILRIAIYELLFSDLKNKIPPKVAIDEAVEIAKTFGGENSSKFVNGVLGTIYRGSDIYDEKEDKKVGVENEKSN